MNPKPLSVTKREELADWFEALAAEYRRPDAGQTQKAIGTAADPTPYPRSASTVPKQRANNVDEHNNPVQPDTPTESAALTPTPAIDDAQHLLTNQDAALGLARNLYRQLTAWRPDRYKDRCSRCHTEFPRGATRCPRIVKGRRCEASPIDNTRTCLICERTMKPGQPLLAGRCSRCKKHLQRHGREWTPGLNAEGLAADGINVTQGVAHA